MLKNTIILICLSASTVGSISGQNYIEQFKNQDYDNISLSLSEDVELKVGKSDKIRGNDKVMETLRQQLTAFSPVRVETRHKGSSEEADGDYLIGKLYNKDGAGLRLFVHLENSGEGRRICAIKLREI